MMAMPGVLVIEEILREVKKKTLPPEAGELLINQWKQEDIEIGFHQTADWKLNCRNRSILRSMEIRGFG